MEVLDLSIFIGYLVVLIIIGLRVSKKTKSFRGFTIAGRSLGFPQMTATIVATFYGATAVIGVAGFAYLVGLGAIWFIIPWYVGTLLVAIFLVKRISKFSKFTMPEAIGSMFDKRCRILSASLLIFYCLVPESIIAIGYLSHSMLGISTSLGMIIATFVIITYTLLGGLRAVVSTDILQFFLMGAGLMIVLVVGLGDVGGFGGIWQNIPPDFKSISGGLSIWDILVLSITIGTLPLVSAQLYQRFFSSSSWKISRRALFTAILCWIIFDFAIIMTGLMARVQNPAGGEELADAALPDLGMDLLPIGVRGLFMVALFAAVMSTADSYLHVAASSFSNDIYRFFAKKGGEKRMLLVARGSIVMFGIFSLIMAFWLQTIVSAIVFLLTVWISGMLLPVILSYKFKLRARTAFAGMLSGAIASISWKAISSYVAMPAYADPLFIGIGACLFGLIIAGRIRP